MRDRVLEAMQARLDEEKARTGDLDAIARILKRQLNRRTEEQIAAMPPAEGAVMGQVGEAHQTSATRRRRSKGVADNTLHAIRAMAAVMHLEGISRPNAKALATRAAEIAQQLKLPGANALNPHGSSMREIADAVLEGIAAAERDPDR
jgi:hypothetical protein